jgi:hypothetical protein
MMTYLERIGCTAAAVAVEKNGNLLLSRGYGFVTPKIETPPNVGPTTPTHRLALTPDLWRLDRLSCCRPLL